MAAGGVRPAEAGGQPRIVTKRSPFPPGVGDNAMGRKRGRASPRCAATHLRSTTESTHRALKDRLLTRERLAGWLRRWDEGSRTTRRRMAESFLAENRERGAREMEELHGNSMALLLSRFTAWLRLTYLVGYALNVQIQAIQLLLRSVDDETTMLDFVRGGSIITLMEMLTMGHDRSVSASCRLRALELLASVTSSHGVTKAILCRYRGMSALKECIALTEDAASFAQIRTLMKNMCTSNPAHSEANAKALLGLLSCAGREEPLSTCIVAKELLDATTATDAGAARASCFHEAEGPAEGRVRVALVQPMLEPVLALVRDEARDAALHDSALALVRTLLRVDGLYTDAVREVVRTVRHFAQTSAGPQLGGMRHVGHDSLSLGVRLLELVENEVARAQSPAQLSTLCYCGVVNALVMSMLDIHNYEVQKIAVRVCRDLCARFEPARSDAQQLLGEPLLAQVVAGSRLHDGSTVRDLVRNDVVYSAVGERLQGRGWALARAAEPQEQKRQDAEADLHQALAKASVNVPQNGDGDDGDGDADGEATPSEEDDTDGTRKKHGVRGKHGVRAKDDADSLEAVASIENNSDESEGNSEEGKNEETEGEEQEEEDDDDNGDDDEDDGVVRDMAFKRQMDFVGTTMRLRSMKLKGGASLMEASAAAVASREQGGRSRARHLPLTAAALDARRRLRNAHEAEGLRSLDDASGVAAATTAAAAAAATATAAAALAARAAGSSPASAPGADGARLYVPTQSPDLAQVGDSLRFTQRICFAPDGADDDEETLDYIRGLPVASKADKPGGVSTLHAHAKTLAEVPAKYLPEKADPGEAGSGPGGAQSGNASSKARELLAALDEAEAAREQEEQERHAAALSPGKKVALREAKAVAIRIRKEEIRAKKEQGQSEEKTAASAGTPAAAPASATTEDAVPSLPKDVLLQLAIRSTLAGSVLPKLLRKPETETRKHVQQLRLQREREKATKNAASAAKSKATAKPPRGGKKRKLRARNLKPNS